MQGFAIFAGYLALLAIVEAIVVFCDKGAEMTNERANYLIAKYKSPSGLVFPKDCTEEEFMHIRERVWGKGVNRHYRSFEFKKEDANTKRTVRVIGKFEVVKHDKKRPARMPTDEAEKQFILDQIMQNAYHLESLKMSIARLAAAVGHLGHEVMHPTHVFVAYRKFKNHLCERPYNKK